MNDENALVLTELSEKSDDDLKSILNELDQEEQRLSFERRTLHAKIDILKAELTARLKEKRKQGKSMVTGEDIERLAEILSRDMKKKTRD